MSSSAVSANQPHEPFIKKSISFNWICVGWAYQLLCVMCDAQYNFGFTNMSETAVWCFAGGVAMPGRPVGCLFWHVQVTVVIIDRCRAARGMSQPITAEVQWDCSGLKLITAVSWALWLNVSAEIPWDCRSLCHTISALFFTLLVFANLFFSSKTVLRWFPLRRFFCCFSPGGVCSVLSRVPPLWRKLTRLWWASCLQDSSIWPGNPFTPSLIHWSTVCTAAKCRVKRWVLLG